MDALEKYVHDFSEPEEKLLHELDRETNLRAVAPRMISGHIQGRLLEMLVRMLRPRRAFHSCRFTPFSTNRSPLSSIRPPLSSNRRKPMG